MTLEEARDIAKIVDSADGGCSYCAASLRKMLQSTFPQFKWGEHQDDIPEAR